MLLFCVTADGAARVETLRGELTRAKKQARVSNAELKAEQATRRQCEERISIVEQELKDAARKCESLEKENKVKATELDKAQRRSVRIESGSRGDPAGRTDSGW
jgi:hypothetical protein